MREGDGKPSIPRKRKFSLQEVAELIAEVDRLKPKFALLNRKDAAGYINTTTRGMKNYTPKALANLASRGLGPPYLKLGNETYYLEQDLNAWILSKRIVPHDFYCETTAVNSLAENPSEDL